MTFRHVLARIVNAKRGKRLLVRLAIVYAYLLDGGEYYKNVTVKILRQLFGGKVFIYNCCRANEITGL